MTPCILVHRYHTVSSSNTATTSNQNFVNRSSVIIHTCHLFIWHTVHRVCWPAVICSVWWYYWGLQIFLSVFLLYFLFWLFLPNHCGCRGLLLHLITLNDTHTHIKPNSVGLLWMRDGPVADLYLTTHNIHNRQTSIPPAGFEPTIPVGERPQTQPLTGITQIFLSGLY